MALVVVVGCVAEGGEPGSALRRDALVPLRDFRTTEARFTGGFRHAPCAPASDAGPDDLIPRMRCADPPAPGTRAFDRVAQALVDVRAALGGPHDADAEHVASVVDVVLRPDDPETADAAVRRLDALRSGAGAGADLLSDLAAAYLTRASLRQDPMDLLFALERATEALELEEDHVEAGFNRALALERLGWTSKASSSWAVQTSREAGRAWQEEVARRGEPPAPRYPAAEPWRERARSALAGGDEPSLRALASAAPQTARTWALFTLLPSWGEGWIAGRTDDADLWAARVLGKALVDSGGDATVWDAVRALDGLADRGDSVALRKVAEAYVNLGRARKRWDESSDYPESGRLASAAARAEPLLGEAVAQEIETFLGAVAMQTGQTTDGDRRFERILSHLDATRYPSIAGRAWWGRGLAAARLGAFQSARHRLERAEAAYRAAMEWENLGTMFGIEASVLQLGGRSTEATRATLRAFDMLTPAGPSVWLANTTAGLGFVAERAGLLRTAKYALTDALAMMGTHGMGIPPIDLMLARARVHADEARFDEARQDLMTARGALDDAGPARAYFEALVRGAELELRVRQADDPELVKEIVATIRAEGRPLLLPRTLLALADAQVAQGDSLNARASLAQAAEAIGASARDLTEPAMAASFVDLADETFDREAQLQLAAGDIEAALRTVARLSRLHSARAEDGIARPPSGTAVVVYAVLSRSVAAWVIRSDSVRHVWIPGGSEAIMAASADLDSSEPESFETALSRVHAELVTPIKPHLAGVSRLVIVPDTKLSGIPFAALRDGTTGRFLVEDYEVALSRSVPTSFSLGRRGPIKVPEDRVLIVAATDFDRRWFSDLPALPGAEREVASLEEVLPGASVLVGPRATPRALLDMLPRAQMLHFAGHALSGEGPGSFSRLVLAPSPDGQSELDGEAIRALDLRGLRLVVLSACRTAGTAGSATSSTLGLAASFLAAGAGAVVASLHDVDDAATITLMTRFHQEVQVGLPPADALRRVQLEALAAARAGHPAPPPMTWGSFIIATH